MVIEIFNENIAVPAKCGTRYFNKCFGNKKFKTSLPTQSEIKTNEFWFKIENLDSWKKVKYLIVRDPFEHLKSAIHTELVNQGYDFYKMKSIIDSFIYSGTNPHWHPEHYRKLYFLHKNHAIPRFKIIHINEITDFLLSLGYDIKYDKEEYNFNYIQNWKSKDECVDIFKTNFPIEWDLLMNMIKNDMEYYDIVVNNKVKLL